MVTADGAVQWLRVLFRVAQHRAERSRFVESIQGRTVDVHFRRPVAYEIDGGVRPATDRLHFEVEPSAVAVRVPEEPR